jgi:hypothetical protein
MLAGFRRLSIGIMWYVDMMVRGIFIQRSMLRDVVVAGVGCVLRPEDGYNVRRNMSPM